MSGKKSDFIAIGENIHCTRIFKAGGRYVKDREGGPSIGYTTQGEKKYLPIPSLFTQSEDWKNGKVRHTAVGIWQGINGAGESVREAGADYIRSMAVRQEAKGAAYLDLNVDEYGTEISERIDAIKWAAEIIQEASRLPLSIDSSNLDILKAGLAVCDRGRAKPMVNSVSLERIPAIRIAADAEAVVVAGATGEKHMPCTRDERIRNLDRIMPLLQSAGFKEAEIFLDPLVFPISVDPKNGITVLEAIRELRRKYGSEIHFAPGLSNVSFGMPHRKLLNQVFTYLCREAGLDGAIVDPLQINAEVLDTMDERTTSFSLARAVLTGEDEFGMNYIAAFRDGTL